MIWFPMYYRGLPTLERQLLRIGRSKRLRKMINDGTGLVRIIKGDDDSKQHDMFFLPSLAFIVMNPDLKKRGN